MYQKKKKTIVLSSHNISLIERLCDKLIVLDKGSIGKNGNMEDIGTNYFKYQCFFNAQVTQNTLENLGIKIVYFKKNGSLINFVSIGEVNEALIKEHIDIVLFENVPIERSEIIAIEMMAAKNRPNEISEENSNE